MGENDPVSPDRVQAEQPEKMAGANDPSCNWGSKVMDHFVPFADSAARTAIYTIGKVTSSWFDSVAVCSSCWLS